MTLRTLPDSSIFASRYRIVRCIAHGGMGAVYEATHLETQRPCAIKVLLPDLIQSDDMRDRFRQEARVTANIRSEFIVDVFDAGIEEATEMPFLVMELLHGEELGKHLKRVKRLAPADVVTYLHQAALALDKAHKASIVHRDLKPANLFLTEREDGSFRVKLVDFGIAKLVSENTTNAAATQNLGTPLYMAPEQFVMGERVSPASDIYALGMLAFTLLVGFAYWSEETRRGANAYSFIGIAVQGPQEPATARAARRGVELPPAFDLWFAKATARNPADRFESATSAIARLAEALAVGVPLSGPRGSMPSLGAFDERAAFSSSQPVAFTYPTPAPLFAATPPHTPVSPSQPPISVHTQPPISAHTQPPISAHTQPPISAPNSAPPTPETPTLTSSATTTFGETKRASSKRALALGLGLLTAALLGALLALLTLGKTPVSAPKSATGAAASPLLTTSTSAEAPSPSPPSSAAVLPAPSADVNADAAPPPSPSADPSAEAAKSIDARHKSAPKAQGAPGTKAGALPVPIYSRN